MKNLLKIILFCPLIINSQVLTDLVSQYARFVSTDVKTVRYIAQIEYNNGKKTSSEIFNKITGYSMSAPELGLVYSAPSVEGIRLINGTVWVGSRSTRQKDVKTLSVTRETWYNENDEVISDVIYDVNIQSKLLIFINDPSVTVQELDNIPYIRTSSAIDIVNSRPFKNETELNEIPFIGSATIEILRDYSKTWVK